MSFETKIGRLNVSNTTASCCLTLEERAPKVDHPSSSKASHDGDEGIFEIREN